MTFEAEAQALSRPIRVAFLVENGEHADLILDGIFADSFRRWGGRFSLIVPCEGGQFSSTYWGWLTAYDPDIVYSYVSFSREVVLQIHERLAPAEYMQHRMHREPRLDVYGFKPDYSFTPLTSLSTIFRQARYKAKGALKILDSWHTENPSKFLADNFGTYLRSFGTGMYPNDARPAATLKTIVDNARYEDRRFAVPRDLDRLANEEEAFRAFINRDATSVSIASILFAPKLEVQAFRWSTAFNLVVGDSFEDRILFWNARLLIPDWLDSELCCLRLEPAQMNDEDFIDALGEFLKRHNHVNNGGGGQPEVALRSVSLTSDQLSDMREKLNRTRPWGVVRTERVQTLDEIVPDEASLIRAQESRQFGLSFSRRSGWKRFNWTPPVLRPPKTIPDHLVDAPDRQQFAQGFWATEFSVGLTKPRPGFVQENTWILPLRWRMAEAFEATRTSDIVGALPPRPRSSRSGMLTLFTSNDAHITEINVPDAKDAIYHALSLDGRLFGREVEDAKVRPEPKVYAAAPSNEARYLAGVLGMAGGLRDAASFLLHPFLTETFAKLGGSPKPPLEKIQPTINRLRKRTKPDQALFSVQDEGDRDALASLIVQAAAGLKTPKEAISLRGLKTSWDEYRAQYWVERPRERPAEDERELWDEKDAKSLSDCLIELRRRQMVFQGHQWSCHNCHHKNWIDLSDLGSDLICGVCGAEQPTPIDIDWQFRPNEFLIECLRDRGVLPVIWVLNHLARQSRYSFFYAPPTKLFYSNEAVERNQPDAEGDLLVLVDGKVLLCEVKPSWTFVSAAHIRSLVALALRLRPDRAIFAVMEEGNRFEAEMAAAKAELEASNITLELLTSVSGGMEDSTYLPS